MPTADEERPLRVSLFCTHQHHRVITPPRTARQPQCHHADTNSNTVDRRAHSPCGLRHNDNVMEEQCVEHYCAMMSNFTVLSGMGLFFFPAGRLPASPLSRWATISLFRPSSPLFKRCLSQLSRALGESLSFAPVPSFDGVTWWRRGDRDDAS